ncbi:MAG TPA: hypothetical protein VFZ45_06735, partial [Actinomycetota bacterium]|nr:hypothetical protein [Actinomycetota bacterium]
ALSKLARLWLVHRFVRIQPFDRDYARLLLPTLAGLGLGIVAHLALAGAPWPVDLLVTAAAASVGYLPVLLWVGLPPAERGAMVRLARAAVGRSEGIPPGGDESTEVP